MQGKILFSTAISELLYTVKCIFSSTAKYVPTILSCQVRCNVLWHCKKNINFQHFLHYLKLYLTKCHGPYIGYKTLLNVFNAIFSFHQYLHFNLPYFQVKMVRRKKVSSKDVKQQTERIRFITWKPIVFVYIVERHSISERPVSNKVLNMQRRL